MVTSGQGEDLRSLPMADLAVALHRAYDNGTDFDRLLSETERRWDAAAEQRGIVSPGFGSAETLTAAPRHNPAPVEQARQYLGTQTLIHSLWLLQEAGVEPSDLYRDPDSLQRVWDVVQREQDRAEAHHGADGEVLAEADPDADAISHLVYWSRLALFGPSEELVHDQRRLAGSTREDLFQARDWLCSEYLTELRGPWALDELLAHPVGLLYHQPLDPDAPEIAVGLEVALGRPGRPSHPSRFRLRTPRLVNNSPSKWTGSRGTIRPILSRRFHRSTRRCPTGSGSTEPCRQTRSSSPRRSVSPRWPPTVPCASMADRFRSNGLGGCWNCTAAA
jgi:hypothetical protein